MEICEFLRFIKICIIQECILIPELQEDPKVVIDAVLNPCPCLYSNVDAVVIPPCDRIGLILFQHASHPQGLIFMIPEQYIQVSDCNPRQQVRIHFLSR